MMSVANSPSIGAPRGKTGLQAQQWCGASLRLDFGARVFRREIFAVTWPGRKEFLMLFTPGWGGQKKRFSLHI